MSDPNPYEAPLGEADAAEADDAGTLFERRLSRERRTLTCGCLAFPVLVVAVLLLVRYFVAR